VGLTAALGYDLPRWSKVSIMLRVPYDYGWIGDLAYPAKSGAVARNWKHRTLLVGLALNLDTRRFARTLREVPSDRAPRPSRER
jgi:hypothetical protein